MRPHPTLRKLHWGGWVTSLIWVSDHTIVLSAVHWDIDAEHTGESLGFSHWVYIRFPCGQCPFWLACLLTCIVACIDSSFISEGYTFRSRKIRTMTSTSHSNAKPALPKLIDKGDAWATVLHTHTPGAMDKGNQHFFFSFVFFFLGQN